jgi:hypothetical protein
MSETAAPSTETPTTTEAGLTIQDLSAVLQVIQVASSRGAFKAEELSSVGKVYDRVFQFLDSAGAIKKAPPSSETKSKETA